MVKDGPVAGWRDRVYMAEVVRNMAAEPYTQRFEHIDEVLRPLSVS